MRKISFLVYGAVAYLVFLISLIYAVGFVGNFHIEITEGLTFVPKGMDFGGPATSTGAAIAINMLLLGLFAIQHSTMARQGFKAWFTRFVPAEIERSTYVLLASLLLLLLFWQWRPFGGIVWAFEEGSAMHTTLLVLNLTGWALAVLSSFLIDHFELLGLRQVYDAATGRPQRALSFKTPFLYRIVRHPLYLGFLLAFWATPIMTGGHLFFAFATTGYVAVGVWFEERDLVRLFGDEYSSYKKRVPAILPLPQRGAKE